MHNYTIDGFFRNLRRFYEVLIAHTRPESSFHGHPICCLGNTLSASPLLSYLKNCPKPKAVTEAGTRNSALAGVYGVPSWV